MVLEFEQSTLLFNITECHGIDVLKGTTTIYFDGNDNTKEVTEQLVYIIREELKK